MSGIFGYKAYKCLDNSTVVLIPLSILTLGIMVVSLVDLITLRSAPRLTGERIELMIIVFLALILQIVSCLRTDSMLWMRVFIVIQLVQSLFLCCCCAFFFFVAKTSSLVLYYSSPLRGLEIATLSCCEVPYLGSTFDGLSAIRC